MPTLDTLATRFARCVSLFRDPGAKSEQKKEFRALLGLLQDTAVTLRVDAGGSGIELNGVPCEGEGLAGLVQRLDLHGIGEIALPATPPPAQLFELLQALADQPGTHDITSRLAAGGADRIRGRGGYRGPDADAVRASGGKPARDIVGAGLVGQRLEQLEELSGRRRGRQGDFADAVEVQALHQPRETLSLARHFVFHDAATT